MGGADCEVLGDGWLAQPVNAWSTLAYLAAAVWVVHRRRNAVAVGGATALVLVFVGSVTYHGPQPRWAEGVHDVSIVLLVAAVAVAVARSGWRPRPVAVIALALGAALYALGRTDGPLCSPSSVLQLHAAWHVATAVAAAAVLGSSVGPLSRRSRRAG